LGSSRGFLLKHSSVVHLLYSFSLSVLNTTLVACLSHHSLFLFFVSERQCSFSIVFYRFILMHCRMIGLTTCLLVWMLPISWKSLSSNVLLTTDNMGCWLWLTINFLPATIKIVSHSVLIYVFCSWIIIFLFQRKKRKKMTCKKVLLSFSKIKGYVSHISCTFLFENKDRNGNLFCPLQLGTPFLLISGSVRNVCHVFCLCLLYTTNISDASSHCSSQGFFCW